eukprot:6081008-Amphidinium_carterae.1
MQAFLQAQKLDPRNASVLAGVAVSQHLLGNLKDCLATQALRANLNQPSLSNLVEVPAEHCNIEDAIDNYHRALSLQRDDAFTAEMLNIAVQDDSQTADELYMPMPCCSPTYSHFDPWKNLS